MDWVFTTRQPCISSCLRMQLDEPHHRSDTVLLLDHIHLHLSPRWRASGSTGSPEQLLGPDNVGSLPCQVMEWSGYAWEVGNESPVVRTHAHVLTNILRLFGLAKCSTISTNLDACTCDYKVQIFHFCMNEATLRRLNIEVSSNDSFKDKLEVMDVFFQGWWKDQDVINVNWCKARSAFRVQTHQDNTVPTPTPSSRTAV